MRFLYLFFFISTSLISQDLHDNSISSEANSALTEVSNSKTLLSWSNKGLRIQAKQLKENKFEDYIDPESLSTDGSNQFHIDFVGTANLQANLSEASDEVQGAAGLGVIFERYFMKSDPQNKLKYEEEKSKHKSFRELLLLERELRRLDRKIKSKNDKSTVTLSKKSILESSIIEKQKKVADISISKDYKRLVESLDMEAYINVASSVDSLKANLDGDNVTNTRLFGNYLLNPISSKQSVFINANVFFNPEPLWVRGRWITQLISGANVRINASNVLWNLADEEGDKSRYAGALNFRFGLFHEFLPNDKIRDEENRRKYSVRLGLNYTFRELTGDISSQTNDPIRNSFLGTTDTSFSGIEPSFGFRLNNIIAEFAMPMIGGESRSDIEGLTDTQFLFSIRFVGGFSLKIDGKKEQDD